MLAYTVIWVIMAEVNTALVDPVPCYIQIIAAVIIILLFLPVGIFKTNALQFGMDQMVEASSD